MTTCSMEGFFIAIFGILPRSYLRRAKWPVMYPRDNFALLHRYGQTFPVGGPLQMEMTALLTHSMKTGFFQSTHQAKTVDPGKFLTHGLPGQ